MTQIAMQISPEPGLDAPSDAVVIERSLRRPERFAAVFDRHYAAIHGYVPRRLGAGFADDVASETFSSRSTGAIATTLGSLTRRLGCTGSRPTS
jgi:hypothetical protein